MGRGQSSIAQVIDLLLKSGFVEAGTTKMQTSRIPTVRSPATCHGRGGGELVTFGGRLRFSRGKQRVTVGRYTTSFYTTLDDLNSLPFKNFVTQDVAAIRAHVEKLPEPEAQA